MIGKVVFTFDLELAWGAIESGPWQRRETQGVYKRTRDVITTLIDTMDELDIGASWAVVGGLMLEPGLQKLDHLPILAREQIDRAISSGQTESFDGRDLIKIIASSNTKQELCCHSYSHTRADFPGYTEETLNQELLNFSTTLPPGIQFSNKYIFPRNIINFTHILHKHGYHTIRSGNMAPIDNTQLKRTIYSAVGTPFMSQETIIDSGMRQVSGSLFLNTGYHKAYRLPLISLRTNRGLKSAIQNGGTLHIWCHPFNLAESTGLLSNFISVLKKVSQFRDSGALVTGFF